MLVVAMVMSLGLVGCGGGDAPSNPTTTGLTATSGATVSPLPTASDEPIQDMPPPEMPKITDAVALGIPSEHGDYPYWGYAKYLRERYGVSAEVIDSEIQRWPDLPESFEDNRLGADDVGVMTLKIQTQKNSTSGQGSVIALKTCTVVAIYYTRNLEVLVPKGRLVPDPANGFYVDSVPDLWSPFYVSIELIWQGRPTTTRVVALSDLSPSSLEGIGCFSVE